MHQRRTSQKVQEKREKKSNKYAFNLYKTFYTAKLHMHPYKKLAVLHGLPDSQVILLFLGFS